MGGYFVTGCAGFIGSNVCRLLLEGGHEVVGFDSLNDAYDVRLKHWRLAQLTARAGFRFDRVDVADRDALATALASRFQSAPNAVIHLAARAGVRPSTVDPWTYYDANVVSTLNLLDYCRERRVAKFVLASSSSVYGNSPHVPYREDQDVSRPISPYAASKQAAETLAYSYHYLHGLDISVLRFFTVYGPAGRPDMSVFRFVRAVMNQTPLTLYGDGTQSRDFTFVDDIARGVLAALAPCGYEIFNLGSDEPHSMNGVLASIARLTGKSPIIEHRPAHRADVAQTWADIAKARAMLGWSPEVSLEEGLGACVQWQEENAALANSLEIGE